MRCRVPTTNFASASELTSWKYRSRRGQPRRRVLWARGLVRSSRCGVTGDSRRHGAQRRTCHSAMRARRESRMTSAAHGAAASQRRRGGCEEGQWSGGKATKRRRCGSPWVIFWWEVKCPPQFSGMRALFIG
jgi:hypothetical protein